MLNRSQVVNVGNYSSHQEPVYCGVPQGSILGPLLFTLFYNDFVDHVSNSKTIMYADDTVIYVRGKYVIKIELCLNENLRNISDYYRKNEMIINLNKVKTKVMLFGSAQRLKTRGKLLQVVYQGHTVNFVTEYKYPGTVTDSHLTLNDNFDKAYKKAISRLRLLHQLRSYLTVEVACNVYAMMIVPLITHSTTHRIPYTCTQYNKLKSLSRRASSIIKCNDNLPSTLCEKYPNTEFFLVRIFLYSG